MAFFSCSVVTEVPLASPGPLLQSGRDGRTAGPGRGVRVAPWSVLGPKAKGSRASWAFSRDGQRPLRPTTLLRVQTKPCKPRGKAKRSGCRSIAVFKMRPLKLSSSRLTHGRAPDGPASGPDVSSPRSLASSSGTVVYLRLLPLL